MYIRMQVQLTPEQRDQLKAMSHNTGKPVAELVRDGVTNLLRSGADLTREERIARAMSAVGAYSSGVTDISENHDDYYVDTILS